MDKEERNALRRDRYKANRDEINKRRRKVYSEDIWNSPMKVAVLIQLKSIRCSTRLATRLNISSINDIPSF
ncbi:hypothetical protein Leryth_026157 [Lithospermum erythrorhizon]|nr:hypothetical protein Leryth_026157 [Lithospermum erythrorhizon]